MREPRRKWGGLRAGGIMGLLQGKTAAERGRKVILKKKRAARLKCHHMKKKKRPVKGQLLGTGRYKQPRLLTWTESSKGEKGRKSLEEAVEKKEK